jgi:GDP-L-fucose synthase
VDLTDAAETRWFLTRNKPDVVLMAAARVGGIAANMERPADFLRENIQIAASVIDGAHMAGVGRLVFFGSSCIYPAEAACPIQEAALLTGPLEATNEAYAVAKIAGVKLCDAYRAQHGREYFSVMPCNLYGPGDNFDPDRSHVPAALIRRFHEAKVRAADLAPVWGSGTPRREFLHVDDLADATIHLLQRWDGAGVINVGAGFDVTIADFAHMVADAIGFRGALVFDPTKPEGVARKLLDVSRLMATGWRPKHQLHDGLRDAYQWFLANVAEVPA